MYPKLGAQTSDAKQYARILAQGSGNLMWAKKFRVTHESESETRKEYWLKQRL